MTFNPNWNKCPSCGHPRGSNTVECELCLEYNNDCRVLVSNPGQDREQSQGAKLEQSEWFINKHLHNMDLDELLNWVSCMNALAAGGSHVYNKKKQIEHTKNKLTVQELVEGRVPNPEALKDLKGDEFKAALKAQRDAQRPKAEKVLLSARDKAIEELVKKARMSREVAASIVDAQMSKEGRHPGGVN